MCSLFLANKLQKQLANMGRRRNGNFKLSQCLSLFVLTLEIIYGVLSSVEFSTALELDRQINIFLSVNKAVDYFTFTLANFSVFLHVYLHTKRAIDSTL